MNKPFCCCIPTSIYSIMEKQPCSISMTDQNIDIINTKTSQIIATLNLVSTEEQAEIVNIKGKKIVNTIPINRIMEVSKKTSITRSKSSKIKSKEKVQLDELPFDTSTPIASMKNLSEKKIVREHIQATLEYISDNISSNESKISALLELSQFVSNVKLVKQASNLTIMLEALKEAKRKKNIPEMKRALLVISNKI
ncbi:hypothetical protein M9Y10_028560 [Tritrichomonas musculus]|uniref:Phosphoprotein n=1 Tax=Tritrichomonas musculus TaxID=1915356 RepID=A0ABR2KJR6_9EUKA